MYHPSRGGVRGGRDQFNWDDVKVDKHRENYIGHSVKAPVGRWQRGKDLHWYTKNNSAEAEQAAIAEISRVQDEEEQAMREALGLAPTRENRSQGNHLNKHELQELFKRGKTAEELSETYVAAERVQGVGFGPVTTKKNITGYERGEQLSGIDSGVDPTTQQQQSSKPQRRELTKEEKREAKEVRKQEKKAAKLARREDRKRRKEEKKHHKHHRSDDESEEQHQQQHSPPTKRHRRRHDSDSE